ncbi:magnesium-dependent phosphatase-1 family protein [Metarhizium album ARSEF 1941]|uniref:Magnesium-dependent phosphatase-1 family protein n=1 Tax=Metarhizium album (strain ARSEF 1941) TaxID=1081103 RepID=A0A0B2WWK2_METAS|nr:magnesium-dependent phosphatase-1 family protein [Metarhizium album ARSEF 1941]KHN98448.1 magnesium-dependent phosphatase-1 family protein [Metarhizium album ARSEF 1941]
MPRRLSKQISFTSLSSALATPSALTSQIPPSLTDPTLPLPKLIVFDLDYTLWPFWVDTHVTPPLKPDAAHSLATDRHGEEYAFYPDVPQILRLLPRAVPDSSAPIKLGVASRTHAPGLARDLLKMLHVPPAQEGDRPRKALDAFDAGTEIYPGSKIRHVEALQRRTGVAFDDILFFDDESRNQETEGLGITMRLVRDGVCWAEIEKGVDDWRRRRGFGRGGV